MLKKISRRWEKEGAENWVRKGRNGRKSLRRLKPIVGCNANKRKKKKGSDYILILREWFWIYCVSNNQVLPILGWHTVLITNYHQQVLRNITLHLNLLDSLNSLLLQEKLKCSSMNLHYWTKLLVQCMLFFVYCERRTSNHNQLLNIEWFH